MACLSCKDSIATSCDYMPILAVLQGVIPKVCRSTHRESGITLKRRGLWIQQQDIGGHDTRVRSEQIGKSPIIEISLAGRSRLREQRYTLVSLNSKYVLSDGRYTNGGCALPMESLRAQQSNNMSNSCSAICGRYSYSECVSSGVAHSA